SGFSANGVAGGGASFGSAPRPPRYGPQVPVKSGAFVLDWACTAGAISAQTRQTNKRLRNLFIGSVLQQRVEQALFPVHCRARGHRATSPGPATRPACRL